MRRYQHNEAIVLLRQLTWLIVVHTDKNNMWCESITNHGIHLLLYCVPMQVSYTCHMFQIGTSSVPGGSLRKISDVP